MGDNETFWMFTRFTDIVNDLKALGRHMSNIWWKGSLLTSMELGTKGDTILEVKDLKKLELEQLIWIASQAQNDQLYW